MTTFLAVTSMTSPVRGLRPWRAPLLRIVNLPKPVMMIGSPSGSAPQNMSGNPLFSFISDDDQSLKVIKTEGCTVTPGAGLILERPRTAHPLEHDQLLPRDRDDSLTAALLIFFLAFHVPRDPFLAFSVRLFFLIHVFSLAREIPWLRVCCRGILCSSHYSRRVS